VAEAMALLQEDPGAWAGQTQSAVRIASVHVEQGAIRSAQAYFLLALQYRREANVSASEALYKRAIAVEPEWSWPYAGLGALLGRHTVGRSEEAIGALRKAIALDPGWGRPHNSLAVVLRIEGRYEEAEKEALAALRLAPDDVAAHNNYANLLVEQQRLDEAEGHYRRAIELEPTHPKPYFNLACLYSLLGRKAEAVVYLRDALERSPNLRTEAATDPDLDALREDPEFRRLLYGEAIGHEPPAG